MTGETSTEGPKKNCESIAKVLLSFGKENQRGRRTGDPSFFAWWNAV